MAITITEDVVSGAHYRYTPQGASFARRFFVSGLAGPQADNCARATIVADSTTGRTVPPYMSAHPTVPNLIVSGYDCWAGGTPESPNKIGVWVDVLYQSPELFPGQNLTQVEIGGVDVTTILNRWPYGPQLGSPIVVAVQTDDKKQLDTQVSFDPQIDAANLIAAAGGPSGLAGDHIYLQYVEIPKLSGATIMKFTRRENNPPDNSMRKKTNLRKWQGLPPGCWLLRDIQSTQVFAGVSSTASGWQTSYLFESCSDDDLQMAKALGQGYGGFTKIEFWKDPMTGRAVPGVTLRKNNGWVAVEPYSRTDFAPLKLPTIYT